MYSEKEIRVKSAKRERHRYKVAVLKMYGKSCAYCGTDRYECLAVDHINNNGAKERLELVKIGVFAGGMWKYLSRSPYQPDKYQILCHNCNIAKYQYDVAPGREKSKPMSWWEEFSKKREPKRNGKVLVCISCGRKKYNAPYHVYRARNTPHKCLDCRKKYHSKINISCGKCGKKRLVYPSSLKDLSANYRCHLHLKGRVAGHGTIRNRNIERS